MDIAKEIHDMKNDLMVVLYGLQPEADEEFRRMGQQRVKDITGKLDELSKKVREGEA